LDIATIGGHDLVAVVGEKNHRRVKDEGHAAPDPDLLFDLELCPRMTVAVWWSDRRNAATSASVISPNSAS
jgi:hypothetical protein